MNENAIAPSTSPEPVHLVDRLEVTRNVLGIITSIHSGSGKQHTQGGEKEAVVTIHKKRSGAFGFLNSQGKDIWFALDDVVSLEGVSVLVNDILKFDYFTKKDGKHSACKNGIYIDSFGAGHGLVEISNALRRMASGERETLENVPGCIAVLRWFIDEKKNKNISIAKDIILFLVRVLARMPLSISQEWSIVLSPIMPRLIRPPHSPILFNMTTPDIRKWIKESSDILVEMASAACRMRCGSPRLWIPLLEAMGMSGVDSQCFIDVFKNSHCPKAGEDNLDIFSWDEIPLVPTSEELQGNQRAGIIANALNDAASIKHLAPVKEDTPYNSSDEYLETYFKLFRADCFTELSKNLQALLTGNGVAFDPRSMAVFKNLSFQADVLESDTRELVYLLRCKPMHSSAFGPNNLNSGNMMALSINGDFKDVIWATLVMAPEKTVRQQIHDLRPTDPLPFVSIRIRFCTEANGGIEAETRAVMALCRGSPSAILVENPVLFSAYQPVLSGIRDLSHTELPFARELVFCQDEIDLPQDYQALFDLSEKEKEIFGTLDPGQQKSYVHFTKHRLALIQGPPGCGKSYLGSRIAYSLIKTGVKPLLVMSYKNHALDEFILDIMNLLKDDPEYSESIVRLGRSPKMNPEVMKCCLDNHLAIARERRTLSSKLRYIQHEAIERTRVAMLRVKEAVFKLSGPIEITLQQWQNVLQDAGIPPVQVFADENGIENIVSAFTKWSSPGIKYIKEELEQLEGPSSFKTTTPATAASLENDFKAIHQKEVEEEEYGEWEKIEEERLASMYGFRISFQNALKQPDSHIITISALAQHYKMPQDIVIPERLPESPAAIAVLIRSVLLRQYVLAIDEFKDALSEYNGSLFDVHKVATQMNTEVLRNAAIICCTSTGAAIYRDSLVNIDIQSLVIEEAAEIPEPALISSLHSSLKRIVMVGDHKQLRPSIASHDLKYYKHLDVSCFERLANNNFPLEALYLQNRMAPELLLPVLQHYPKLESNMEIVSKLKFPPDWLEKPLFWWTHTENETKIEDSQSKINPFEADRACTLAVFLIKQGFSTEDVVILTPYRAQLIEIRTRLSRENKKDPAFCFKQIRSATVDEFQGDECNVVILSLVRSSDSTESNRSDIGFLNELNRQIVAVSRQKTALIIIGNHHTIGISPKWKFLIDSMFGKGLLDARLPLICPRHKVHMLIDKPPHIADFCGCGEMCGAKLECGHECTGKCHSSEKRHSRCDKMLKVTYPCGHSSEQRCGQKKESRCEYTIIKKFPCGHSRETKCWEGSEAQCTERCKKILPCGHQCCLSCPVDCSERPCRTCIDLRASDLRSSRPVLSVLPQFQSLVGLSVASEEQQQTTSSNNKISVQQQVSTNNSNSIAYYCPLTAEHASILLVIIETLGIQYFALWRLHVLPQLTEADYFGGPESEPSSEVLSEYGKIEKLQAREQILNIVLSEIGIRVPKEFSCLPNCFAYLALLNTLRPDVIGQVRKTLGRMFGLCTEDTLKKFSTDLPRHINSCCRMLYNFTTGNDMSRRYSIYSEWTQSPMEDLAAIITTKLEAHRLLHLTHGAAELAQEWNMWRNIRPESKPESRPPHEEVVLAELYLPRYHNQCFISIDLKKADFQILRLFDPELVAGCDTWEKFLVEVLKFENKNNPHALPPGLEEFRGIRTRVLGKLCHVKNKALQSHILRLLARAIIEQYAQKNEGDDKPGDISEVFRFSNDELIIRCKKRTQEGWERVLKTVNTAIDFFIPKAKPIIRITAFRLHAMKFTKEMTRLLPENNYTAEYDVGDDYTLLTKGHPALRNDPYIEPPAVFDAKWNDPSIRETRERGYFFVRESLHLKEDLLTPRKLEPKCLPVAVSVLGMIEILKKFHSDWFLDVLSPENSDEERDSLPPSTTSKPSVSTPTITKLDECDDDDDEIESKSSNSSRIESSPLPIISQRQQQQQQQQRQPAWQTNQLNGRNRNNNNRGSNRRNQRGNGRGSQRPQSNISPIIFDCTWDSSWSEK